MKRYLRNLLISFDQHANCWLGGNPDETISSRVGKAACQDKRWALICAALIDWLFLRLFGERDHCLMSIEWDEV